LPPQYDPSAQLNDGWEQALAGLPAEDRATVIDLMGPHAEGSVQDDQQFISDFMHRCGKP
jgi:hypothetical protein